MREHRLGIISSLKIGAKERNINVRILTPVNHEVQKIIQTIEKEENFHIRIVDITYQEITVNTVTILVVDRKASLAIEKVDDSKDNFLEAIGLATYSDSKPTVSSYISIFEIIWNQTKLYGA